MLSQHELSHKAAGDEAACDDVARADAAAGVREGEPKAHTHLGSKLLAAAPTSERSGQVGRSHNIYVYNYISKFTYIISLMMSEFLNF